MTAAPDLREIVHRLGGDLYEGGRAAVIPGPDHSRRDRSLSLRLSDDGARVLFHSFAEDSPRAIMTYLGIAAGHAPEPTWQERQRMQRIREAQRKAREAEALAFCRTIWDGGEPVEGTPVERYLYNRGLILEGCPVVRFHPAAPRGKEDGAQTLPAMVALASADDGSPRGLHVTYLTDDGRKAFGERSRLMFGPVAGCAVRLMRPADGVLALAEGIETAGSYSAHKGVPAWAALSTSGLRGFVLPHGIKKLVIAADGDDAGMAAAQELADRMKRRCDIEIDPAPPGKDWNDVLVGGVHV